MPWFPDFASAVELARRQTRAAGLADPVGEYFAALNQGDTRALEKVWPGEVVIYDPRAGEVRGHHQVRRFIGRNLAWLAGLHTRTERVADTCAGRRAVVELLAHLDHDGRELSWPVAVVAESPDDLSVVFRTYCSQWPVDERRHIRPPILGPGPVTWSAGTTTRWPPVTPKRWCARSRRTGTSVGRSARTTPTAAPLSCDRSTRRASVRAAASAWRPAR